MDDSEPLGYRLLTDEELAEITKPETREPSIMPMRKDIAYRLAQQIFYLRLDADRQLGLPHLSPFERGRIESQWGENVLKACENAVGCQDRMIAELQRMATDILACHPSNPIIQKSTSIDAPPTEPNK